MLQLRVSSKDVDGPDGLVVERHVEPLGTVGTDPGGDLVVLGLRELDLLEVGLDALWGD